MWINTVPGRSSSCLSCFVPIGEKLLILDEAEELIQQKQPSSTPDKNTPEGLFSELKPYLSDELVKQVNGSFLYELSGKDAGYWLIDLKSSPGSVTPASESAKADVRIKMDSEDMVNMATGKLNSTMAYMTGKLKISGNMALAMKLWKVLANIRAKL